MECVMQVISVSHKEHLNITVTKDEVREIQAGVKEQLFNASLKFEMQHKHHTEILKVRGGRRQEKCMRRKRKRE